MPARYHIDPRLDPSETELLRRHLEDADWAPTERDDWTLHWSAAVPPLRVYRGVRDGQLVNHFPGVGPLHYKDELAHHLAAAGHTFHPTTFSMPHERNDLLAAMAAEPDSLWLRKRKRWMAGEGMAIITDEVPVPTDHEWLVQRYVSDPLLLPGQPYKHVLRRYVVITSLDPLVGWVHPNGPVKFTTRPYSLDPSMLGDPVVHLTNPPIQRTNTDPTNSIRGVDQHRYRTWLAEVGIDGDTLFGRIDRMLADALLALHAPVLRLSRQWAPRLDACFELLGFDLIVDAALDPWLLECNISPALGVRGHPGTPQHAAQFAAKDGLVRDLLRRVGLLDGPDEFEPLIRAEAACPDLPRRPWSGRTGRRSPGSDE